MIWLCDIQVPLGNDEFLAEPGLADEPDGLYVTRSY